MGIGSEKRKDISQVARLLNPIALVKRGPEVGEIFRACCSGKKYEEHCGVGTTSEALVCPSGATFRHRFDCPALFCDSVRASVC